MEPFKHQLSHNSALIIAAAIQGAYPEFQLKRFSKHLKTELEPLELKQRVEAIATRIENELPTHPPTLFSILIAALAPTSDEPMGLQSFLVWPLTEIISRRGLHHHQAAMKALEAMTSRFTGEFGIRTFIDQRPEATFKQLLAWTTHEFEHVRRLASEGSRPILPWGQKLPQLLSEQLPTLPILEKLYQDPSVYVRRSVANHLNDISKFHPDRVIEILKRWQTQSPENPHFKSLSKHACRTLLKSGHVGALSLQGFKSNPSLNISQVQLSHHSLSIGEVLHYQIVIHNPTSQDVAVMFDYTIHHRKANGTTTPKVFKGRIKTLSANETWSISGKHPFKPITTRVYHSGIHFFEPQINGLTYPKIAFTLSL